MAINQPPITGNPVVDAWMLEVTRELNGGTGVSTSTSTPSSSSSVITSVSVNDILRLSNGVLSNAPLVNSIQVGAGQPQTGNVIVPAGGGGGFSSVNIVQNDYMTQIADPGTGNPILASYTFPAAPSPIPDAHMVFLGGMRLCETPAGSTVTRDYTTMGNTIILQRTSRDLIGLDLVLTVFTATLS